MEEENIAELQAKLLECNERYMKIVRELSHPLSPEDIENIRQIDKECKDLTSNYWKKLGF